MTIYIKNLPHEATKIGLIELFEEYGSVKKIIVPIDEIADKIIGFAFVEMLEDIQEKIAISELNGSKWMGYQLQVRKSRSDKTSALFNYYT